MFDSYRHIALDSVVPPAVDEELLFQESQLRLETLCACVIVKSKVNCHLLSNIPTHLHKILWAAYLRDEYYAHRDKIDVEADVHLEESELFLDVIPELFYHWPHEEFVLKEIMPTFPPRPNRFSNFRGLGDAREGPYLNNLSYLEQFSKYVINAIVRCCINNKGRFPELHKNYGKVKKINISGFGEFKFADMSSMTQITDPFYKNKDGKLEILLDVELDCENICLENWFTECFSNSTDFFVIKVGEIEIYGTDNTEKVTRIITKLVNDGAFSIILRNVEGSVLIEKVFENNANQKNILSVDLNGCAKSLNIMLYFINLVQLDLSSNNLHGQLDFLLHMHRGLISLNLDDCSLKNKDLDKITRSCHQSTLQELRLNCNTFEYDDNSDNLLRLCESLLNILELELAFCELHSWPSKAIQLLFISFRMMPNIKYLYLLGNYFGIDTITMHIMILEENSSLRYLHLTLASQITDIQLNNEDDLIKSFNSEISAKINKKRSQLLYVELDN